jgi:lysyl-tRNA synthetase class 2
VTGEKVPESLFPPNFCQILQSRHRITQQIRAFFDKQNYLEVETPLRVICPGVDPYIDALPAGNGFFLSTSPELQMKRLLGLGLARIYQITHAFRANEQGAYHNSEFSLLEWYRIGTGYLGLMDETEELLKSIIHNANIGSKDVPEYKFPFPRITIDDLFKEEAGWEPSKAWDENRYFADWVEKIDPYLGQLQGVFIIDFPAPLASLSKIKDDNPLICERFELFMRGIEIANAFTELTDYEEQVTRFETALETRIRKGKDAYEIDEKFLEALKAGIPACAGIALGVDRLVMALLGYHDISMVQTFPHWRL